MTISLECIAHDLGLTNRKMLHLNVFLKYSIINGMFVIMASVELTQCLSYILTNYMQAQPEVKTGITITKFNNDKTDSLVIERVCITWMNESL